MQLGVIIGTVGATKKVESLAGQTFLLVAPEGHQGPALVCADRVGAGLGDRVLVCHGSAARPDGAPIPVDAAVVGIVDHMDPD
ncbi:MAG: EutN/CcmL family microcompartment protein [Intestinimonas sp.]|jgi:ethanolamine utilization protein EutN|nr:EutN/CcmL family microcompartment protein [Intestinimonas sp.]